MNVITHSVLPFGSIIVGLIVLHEFGHFVTAKLTGVKVLEAGLGYPPRIWGFRRGETEYTINWIPLGGFVRMLGEEDPSDPRSLAARPRLLRLLVLASGSGMNFLGAIALFSLALMIPRTVYDSPARITYVVPDSPAATAGVEAGDIILAINGKEVDVNGVRNQILLHQGETVTFRVKRGSETKEFDVYARWAPPKMEDPQTHEVVRQGPTGIQIAPQYTFTKSLHYNPLVALKKSFGEARDQMVLARNQIISWIKGANAPQVTGPVGIAQATGEVVKEAGWKSLLDFAGLLSLNLAILNILPLPMLDGGRVVFVLIEIARRGKRIAPQKEAMVHFIGLVTLLTLAVVITYFDIARVFRGENVIR